MKIVGIIGGMGPEATVEFMRRIVAATPAEDDSGHLHLLVDNNPHIPSRIAHLIDKTGEDPGPTLCAMAQGLERQGAQLLAMPCNTAHHYLPEIARSVSIPVLDMVARSVAKLSGRRIGILASPAVRLVGLYAKVIERTKMRAVFPSEAAEQALLHVIRAVKAGRTGAAERDGYARIAEGLAKQGVDEFLIACTELSVLGPPEGIALPSVDALDVLVAATVNQAC